jgi:hypothetical protein
MIGARTGPDGLWAIDLDVDVKPVAPAARLGMQEDSRDDGSER